MARLITDYYDVKGPQPVSNQDAAIYKYIYSNKGSEDYSSLIRDDHRYIVQYTFNDYRSSILRWYPFRTDSKALEIGADYGGLTGALLDNCVDVVSTVSTISQGNALRQRYIARDNLTIYVCNELQDIDFSIGSADGFDYIVCFRELEFQDKPAEYLDYLYSLLNDHGVLLLEVENKYGIDNLCGAVDSHTGIPFDSIAGYPDARSGHGFHRAELKSILDSTAFDRYRFYYPMPDYIAPRAIYTDQYQPQQNMGERLVTYDRSSDTLIADTRPFFLEAAANGAFSFVANSFLVEIAKGDMPLSDAVYITLTGYRDRAKAFATVVGSQGIVKKKCLFPTGQPYAEGLCSKIDRLKDLGIKVLPMTYHNGYIEMDYVDAPTLQQHIAEMAQTGCSQEEMFDIYDKMWDNIQMVCRTGQAYLEMIPLNSFWIDGDIVYFDQEYVRTGYSDKYIMFRCIVHSYGQISELEAVIPQTDMFDRYGISAEEVDELLELEFDLAADENPGMFFLPQTRSAEKMRENRKRLKGEI